MTTIPIITLIAIATIIILVHRLGRNNRVAKILNGYGVNRRLKELLFERSVYAVIATDLYGKILMWNQSAHRKFGYTEAEMIGKNIQIIMPERFRMMHELGMQHYRDTGESKLLNNNDGIEVFGLHKNGNEFPVHLKLILINDNGFLSIGGFIRNITKDKEKEKVLTDEIFLLRQGEKCAEIVTWYWDTLSKDVVVSENFYELFDIDKDDKITSVMLMELVYYKDRLHTAQVITQATEKGEDYKTTYRRMLRDGSLRLFEVRGCQIYDEDGEPVAIIETIQKLADGVDGT